MSDTFDPGPGWRASTAGEAKPYGSLRYSDGTPEHEPQWWVREAPVLPLPTAPHTVIRAEWQGGMTYDLVLVGEDRGWYFLGTDDHVRPETLAAKINSFEVLSEPRTVTAKAVLDRVRDEVRTTQEQYERLDNIAAAFGAKA